MGFNRPTFSLTQTQIKEFFLCNHQHVAALPREVERLIICNALLEHVAFARLKEAEEIIAFDPTLLLREYASDVTTPAGLYIKNITPYECALSAGDVGMKKMMFPYFMQLKNGQLEEKIQYEKYRPFIENILTQTPYNLYSLMKTLKKSSPEDVTAELNRHKDERYHHYKSELRNSLEQFRKEFMLNQMTSQGMQFNYNSLLHAYKIYREEVINLVSENADKCWLFIRLVIAFELRSLPGRDRQIYARGLWRFADEEESAPRSFTLAKNTTETFPHTYHFSRNGLGYDFCIDSNGGIASCELSMWNALSWLPIFILSKTQKLTAPLTISIGSEKYRM